MIFFKDSVQKTLPFCIMIVFLLGGCGSVDSGIADNMEFDPPQARTSMPAGAVVGEFPTVNDGFIRLILNETNGAFSLLYHPEVYPASYKPLFSNKDPRTSYLSVSFNGRVHHLGKSSSFNTRMERIGVDPALIFESSFLTVSQVFTPIKTVSSSHANGIMITITIENTGEDDAEVGLRFLLDTDLGERKNVPFKTDQRSITNEFLLTDASGDKYWISPGETFSLMGSIINPVDSNVIQPDFIHFANWKRLNDSRWMPRYLEGRSFTNFPFSIRDSAVCYFYEPALLISGGYFEYTIFLTTEDVLWYSPSENISTINFTENVPSTTGQIQAGEIEHILDFYTLLRLQELLDRFIAGEIELNENDLAEIERIIHEHRY